MRVALHCSLLPSSDFMIFSRSHHEIVLPKDLIDFDVISALPVALPQCACLPLTLPQISHFHHIANIHLHTHTPLQASLPVERSNHHPAGPSYQGLP